MTRRPPGARPNARRVSESAAPLDAEALLAALVLVPASYSRNRFFALYAAPAMGRVRRRASTMRSLVRDVLTRANDFKLTRHADGFELSVSFVREGGQRRVRLSRTELALVGAVLARAPSPKTLVTQVLAAILAQLGPGALTELGALFVRLLATASAGPRNRDDTGG